MLYIKNLRNLLVLALVLGTLFSTLKGNEIEYFKPINEEVCLAERSYPYDLSILAIFQNEAPYLKEWIEFHKLMGVQHFYLYNNLSEDDYLKILKPYLESGEVELVDWEYDCHKQDWSRIQINAYADALPKLQTETKWLAVIDIDEFLIPLQSSNLIQFLANYENEIIAGVRVNWQMYGTSFIKKLSSASLMIEQLLFKAPSSLLENKCVKSIIRPERVSKIGTHFSICSKPYVMVNSDKIPCYSNRQKIIVDKIRINHYWLRDEEFCLNVKIPRLKAATKWKDEAQLFKMFDRLNQEYDGIILPFVAELKKRMDF